MNATSYHALERTPPSSPEAEAALLGSLILDRNRLDDVPDLAPEHFYDQAHASLFRDLLDMHQAGRPHDLLTLTEHLKAAGTYDRIGGAAALARLAQSVPNAAHTKHYAGIICEKARRRELIDAAAILLAHAHDDRRPPAAAVATLEHALAHLTAEDRGPRPIATGADLAAAALDALERRKAGTAAHLPTGFPTLDRLLGGGLEPGELAVLGARTSIGKTALALNLAAHALRAGRRVLVFSIEMIRDEIGKRLIASAARVSALRVDLAGLTPDEESRYLAEARRLHSAPLLVDDAPAQTIGSLTSTARRLARTHRPELLIVDYLQLIEPTAKGHTREREVSEISRRLKALAQELRIPILALVQLNRQGVDERPRIHHLRESDAIAHEANRVLLLHRPDADAALERGRPETVELIIDKNRSGPRGLVHLLWFRDSMRFETAADEHHEKALL